MRLLLDQNRTDIDQPWREATSGHQSLGQCLTAERFASVAESGIEIGQEPGLAGDNINGEGLSAAGSLQRYGMQVAVTS